MLISLTPRKIFSWIIRFIQLQLFITLVSLPLFLAWGLPISLLSPLGNLVFSPFLTVFLFLSSLIFFCELFFIPNAWFIIALEWCTKTWLSLMHADCHTWLIGFMMPSYIFLLFVPLCTLSIVLYRKTRALLINCVCMSMMLMGIGIYLKQQPAQISAVSSIVCNKGELTLIHHNNQLIVIDPGYLGQRVSAPAWAQYTLLPHLIKTTGKMVVDHYILMQPSATAFKALEQLYTKTMIKNLYVPYWHNEAPKPLLRNYMSLKGMLQTKKSNLMRIDRALSIALDEGDTLSIKPLPEMIHTSTISYRALCVEGCIDKQTITIYSAKCKKLKKLDPIKNNND